MNTNEDPSSAENCFNQLVKVIEEMKTTDCTEFDKELVAFMYLKDIQASVNQFLKEYVGDTKLITEGDRSVFLGKCEQCRGTLALHGFLTEKESQRVSERIQKHREI